MNEDHTVSLREYVVKRLTDIPRKRETDTARYNFRRLRVRSREQATNCVILELWILSLTMQSQTYFIVVLSDIRNRYQMLDQIYIAFSFFCVLLYVFYFEAESMIEMIQYVGVV